VPKRSEGLRKSSGKLKSPLAVFYVEQVALNRHVFKCDCKIATLAATPAASFMLENGAEVNSNLYFPNGGVARFLLVGAQHRRALLANFVAVNST
jgi:hypothetical protein